MSRGLADRKVADVVGVTGVITPIAAAAAAAAADCSWLAARQPVGRRAAVAGGASTATRTWAGREDSDGG